MALSDHFFPDTDHWACIHYYIPRPALGRGIVRVHCQAKGEVVHIVEVKVDKPAYVFLKKTGPGILVIEDPEPINVRGLQW